MRQRMSGIYLAQSAEVDPGQLALASFRDDIGVAGLSCDH
jgi:hypothetical protein